MISTLLQSIGDFYRSVDFVTRFPMLESVLAAIDDAHTVGRCDPDLRPATRHLDHVVNNSGIPEVESMVGEFLAVARGLPWTQTAGYLEVLSSEYLDNYAYVRLIGPDSLVEHPDVRVGIGLWGPLLDYPLHEHEAEELYHVLHGEPQFRIEGSEYAHQVVGGAIHHDPWVRHAQRFGGSPTLLLYAWTGAIDADAVIVDYGEGREMIKG